MMCYLMGFWDSVLFAVFITFIMVGWAWCAAFVVTYSTGEAIRKGKGEEDAKFLIKITKLQ